MTFQRASVLSAVALMLMASRDAPTRNASLSDTLSADGVYTWRVPATEEAPAWCCYNWSGKAPVPGVCNLDSNQGGFGSNDDEQSTLDGEVQIYASIASGRVERIRALSPSCSVKSRRTITDLGMVAVDASLTWLESQVRPHAPQSENALAAIAMHLGSEAMRYLTGLANAEPVTEIRKDAIFWMGQVRIKEAAGELEDLMFRDRSDEIREQAAFSLSQSEAANRGDLLIRQGRDDKSAEVRSKAWFWLAQTELPGSEDAIQSAIADDRDEDVREEAVFALSQLPDERAVDALFAVLGNSKLPEDVRKQALFWLAQSDSDRAYEYLDRLLTMD